MRNLAALILCYEHDASLLEGCVKQLRAVMGEQLVIVVADDAAAPMSHEQVPAGVEYLQTTFPRGGSLRGLPCVRGILSLIKGLCEQLGVEGIVKVDADVLVTGCEWLAGDDDFIGFEGSSVGSALGMLYYMSARAADLMLEGSMSWAWSHDADVAEDTAMSLLARDCLQGCYDVKPYAEGRWVKALCNENFPNIELLGAGAGLHFGQRELLECYPQGMRAVQVARWFKAWGAGRGLAPCG